MSNKRDSIFSQREREIQFYNDESSVNYRPVTEKDVNNALFNIYKDYTEQYNFSESKLIAEEYVNTVTNTYQEILNLSHESSLNNNGVNKKAEIVNFLIYEGRLMSEDELNDRDAYVEKADDLIGEKMVPLMDSLNEAFEKYDMDCRFVNLDDFAEVREQALEMEEALTAPIYQRKEMADIKRLQQNRPEKMEDARIDYQAESAIKNAGKNIYMKTARSFDNFAEKRHYRNSYSSIQKDFESECKELGVPTKEEDFSHFQNPNFAKTEAKTVYSDEKNKDDGFEL